MNTGYYLSIYSLELDERDAPLITMYLVVQVIISQISLIVPNYSRIIIKSITMIAFFYVATYGQNLIIEKLRY